MRHRSKHGIFDRQKSRIPSTFIKYVDKIPHLAQHMLHSKSTYFYRWGSRKKNGSNKVNKFRVANLLTTTRFTTCLHQLSYVVPSVCILALLVGGVVAISPTIDNKLFAYATSEGFSYEPSIAITVTAGDVNQETKAVQNSVTYRTNNFKVAAKDVSGYNVYVQAAYGYTGQLRGQADPSQVINGVGMEVPPEAFLDDTWGYSVMPVDSSTTTADPRTLVYNSVPNNDDPRTMPAYSTAQTDGEQDFTLAFAAKFGDYRPADHYTTNVNLSVVAGAKYVSGFAGILHMQDMDSNVCASADVGDSGRLIDTRDRKAYWVAKLADNNCWMTQNLDLDLSTSKTLTPADTDLTADWTPNRSTTVGTLTGWTSNSTEVRTTPFSYDPGEYVYKYPLLSNECKLGNDLPDNLNSCVGDIYNWVDVSELIPYKTEVSQADDVVTVTGSNYDAHYLVGNYYNWAAATAGTYNYGYNSQAPSSICPKGWKLPLSGGGPLECRGDATKCTYKTTSGSFQNLLAQYGISGSSTTGTANGLAYDVKKAPLYFASAGYAGTAHNNTVYNKIRGAGSSGVYSSSVAATSSDQCYAEQKYCVWNFEFIDNYMRSETQYNAWGQSIRCYAD